ncbi:MAG: DUF1837 domain-containing protein [Candidatus Omnitrophota bacterium]
MLEEKISEATLRAYHVGFENNKFRLQPLVDVICDVILEFALGYDKSVSIAPTEIRAKLREAALRVYDTDKYKKRGEFGELILHLFLRDFCETIPLISKIYFKDTSNAAVHGFDAVHITIKNGKNKLWLGESKLYTNGTEGVRSLVKDLVAHTKANYLRKEFMFIAPKIPSSTPLIEHWRRLMHRHQTLESIYHGICIPMVCTYSSDVFRSHSVATRQYLDDFTKECHSLKAIFDVGSKKVTTDIDVMLMLLPVPCKDELIKELHKRLRSMQSI